MINAEVGLNVSVIGNSMAMVADGPMPGNTPMSVPSVTPSRHSNSDCRLSATLNPRRIPSNISMGSCLGT